MRFWQRTSPVRSGIIYDAMVTTERVADDFKLGHKKSPNSLLSQHLIEFDEDFKYYHANYKSI